MGRLAVISYEQVAQVCESLVGEGRAPGTFSWSVVRQRLGNAGSSALLTKHILAWEKERTGGKKASSIELPPTLAKAFVAELEKAHELGRGELQEIVSQYAGIEEQRDALIDDAARLTTERDQAVALAGERSGEIDRLRAELRQAQEDRRTAETQATERKAQLEDLRTLFASQQLELREAREAVLKVATTNATATANADPATGKGRPDKK